MNKHIIIYIIYICNMYICTNATNFVSSSQKENRNTILILCPVHMKQPPEAMVDVGDETTHTMGVFKHV